MSQFFFFLLICSIFFIVIAIQSNTRLERHERIRAYLRRRDKEVVEILPKPMSAPNGGSNLFEVTYLTADNELYKANCMIWRNSELFWTEPEFVRRASEGTGEGTSRLWHEPVEFTAESTNPNKEQLINGLTSAFVHERIWTVREIGKLDVVDELVLYILIDMSRDDPDQEVRKTALEVVSSLA